MAWSDAARAAAREARRLRGGPAGIERRYRRATRGYNEARRISIDAGDKLERLEAKTDDWGREKHSAKQIRLQDVQRAAQKRYSRWKKAFNQYRIILGKEPY